jgi:hypothetical protein
VIRVDSIEDMLITAGAAAALGRLARPGIGIVSISGGAGAAVIDPGIFTRAIEAMSQDPAIGVVGVISSLPWAGPGRPYVAQALVDAIGAGMLDGHRGTAPAGVGALAGLIARVGDLAVALGGDLDTLEINPLRVAGASIEALDAVDTWTRKGQP